MLATEAPIDSIVRDMKRGRNYTLGLGRATSLSSEIARGWPGRVANSLCYKTQRRTLLIETESTEPLGGSTETGEGDLDITTIQWTICSEPTPSNASPDRQMLKHLGSLPKWKEQYPLTILHLGTLDSPAFATLGKLCDGIALAADMSQSQGTSLRELSKTLRHHQAHGCRLLGMWSVEIG